MKKSTLAFASGLFSYAFVPDEALPYLAIMLAVTALLLCASLAVDKHIDQWLTKPQ